MNDSIDHHFSRPDRVSESLTDPLRLANANTINTTVIIFFLADNGIMAANFIKLQIFIILHYYNLQLSNFFFFFVCGNLITKDKQKCKA
jgi:hypothetical protein